MDALEAHGAVDVATIYALARHTYLAKLDDKAAGYNRLAGEFAARSFAPLVARQHFERALECYRRLPLPDHSTELEVALDLAVQLDRLGELQAAERFLSDALSEAGRAPETSPPSGPWRRCSWPVSTPTRDAGRRWTGSPGSSSSTARRG